MFLHNQNFEKKVLLFVSGGISAEYQIALLSAQNVYPYIDRNLFEVIPVFIAPNGWWYLSEVQAQNWPQLEFLDSTAEFEKVELLPLVRTTGTHGLGLRTAMQEILIDLIFPMIHGPSGEDGTIQGLAQFFGIPIVGSDMNGSLINMNKQFMKIMLKDKGIPCARYRSFCRRELRRFNEITFDKLGAELFSEWQCPSLFVKPARMGSSIGITQVKQVKDLAAALHLALEYDDKLLIEEGLCVRELELAAIELEDGKLQISNVAQIHSNGEFYSYEQKYLPQEQKKALVVEVSNDLPPELLQRARKLAAQAFVALAVRHYCRVDLFYLETEDRLLFNEINTIPGFTENSMFPKLMEAEGWPLKRLIPHLLQLALSFP